MCCQVRTKELQAWLIQHCSSVASDSMVDWWCIVDWLKAAQAFMILALFTLPAALAIVAAYAFVAEFEGNMKVLGGAMGLTAVAGSYCYCYCYHHYYS